MEIQKPMITPPKKELVQTEFLMPANPKRVRCVDERKAKDTIHDGIAVPGGIYGIIDTIKSLKGMTEEEAWKLATNAGIPIGGHIDEHHGSKGCGYAKLVETEPQTVEATESIPAEKRKTALENAHGDIVTLLGDHQPTEAVINFRAGWTIDTARAIESGRGIFDFDIWAMPALADTLGIDQHAFTDHMCTVYKKTVTRLTGITQFDEIT